MIGGGSAAFQQPDLAVGISGGSGDNRSKVFNTNMMRTGARHQRASGAKHFEGAQIQLFIAAQRSLGGALRFSEGRRVENDGVELDAGMAPLAEQVEGVG